MKRQEAVRPEFFKNLPTLLEEQQAKKKGISTEEQLYYSLSQTQGWMQLKAYIDSLIKDLDQATAKAMQQGLPFEEIGRNAVVIDLAKGIIRNILNRVEDAREAAENPDGQQA